MEQLARRKFLTQVAGVAGLAGIGSVIALTPETAQAQRRTGSQVTTPVTGTLNGVPIKASTLTVTQFAATGNQIVAAATATLTDVNNTTRVLQLTNIPVQVAQASCQILNLTLGPLDLDLLGLQVHLNQIHLIITANPAGGLLGQLLCSLANLLNGGSPLLQIVAVLNQILALLGA